jgi:hypothetical protein
MALDENRPPSSMRSQYEQLVTAERALDRRQAELDHKSSERPLDQQQRADLLNAQRKASEVYQTLSRSEPAPLPNEPALHYRVRAAVGVQDHSPQWRYTNLYNLARSSPSAFTNAETEIFEQATKDGLDPTDAWRPDSNTRLRERIVPGHNGAPPTSTFHGSAAVTIAPMTGAHQLAVKGWGPRFPQFRRS